MNKNQKPTFQTLFRRGVFVLALLTATATQANTLWTGPNITFQQFNPSTSDVIIPGAVELNRGANGPLFNSAATPANTMWAFGTLDSNAPSLSYVTFASLRNGDLADVIKNKNMVLHIFTNSIVHDDIYVAVKFSAWGQHFAGGFTYVRSTAPAAVPPTVNITTPTNGASFTAPANVAITASASVSGGTVTNVSFLQGATVLGSVTTAPFSITASNLAAGPYAFTAIATAGGLSTTSAVVNITVTSPATGVTLSSPQISNNQFIFSYNANPGSSYVVQSSPNLTTWTSLSTNIAAGNPVTVTNPIVPSSPSYFRVGLLPGH